MSILIKGMEMPKSCKECPLEQIYGRDGEVAKCPLTEKILSSYLVSETRMSDCPLIEIPDVYIDISKAFMTELANKVCIKGNTDEEQM